MQRFSSYTAQSPCALCQGRDGTLIQTQDRHSEPLTVTCCRGCGLTYVDPIPSQDELARFYAQRYRQEYKQATTPKLKHIYRAGRVAMDRFRHVALLSRPGARVLECGAGGGEFAYLMASRGYRYTGIEPNDGYREYAKSEYGVDLRAGTLDDASFEPSQFDLITIFHVLEHLRDPRDGLKRLAQWLRPGGHLYVEVPNALTAISSPSNLYHRAHLYYFAAQPLIALGMRAGLVPLMVDGGESRANLVAIFSKSTSITSPFTMSSAHDAIVSTNRNRSLGRYLRSGRTLTQLPIRLWQRSSEHRITKKGGHGRDVLDALYSAEAPLVYSPDMQRA